jgi:hypothetical protein
MGFLGSLFKGITGAVGGFLTGGPAGAVLGGVRGLVGGGVPSAAALPTAQPMYRSPLAGAMLTNKPSGIPAFSMPGGARLMTASGTVPQKASVTSQIMSGCPPGYHLGTHKSLMHPFGGCARNRRMNVANVHALRRSIRRLTGFEKLARRVLRITSPRPVRVGFKRTTRRKR